MYPLISIGRGHVQFDHSLLCPSYTPDPSPPFTWGSLIPAIIRLLSYRVSGPNMINVIQDAGRTPLEKRFISPSEDLPLMRFDDNGLTPQWRRFTGVKLSLIKQSIVRGAVRWHTPIQRWAIQTLNPNLKSLYQTSMRLIIIRIVGYPRDAYIKARFSIQTRFYCIFHTRWDKIGWLV